MNITINVPDEQLNRVINAMCNRYGYSAESGLTKAQFAKQCLIRFMKAAVMADESEAAVADYDAKKKAASDLADSEITIT